MILNDHLVLVRFFTLLSFSKIYGIFSRRWSLNRTCSCHSLFSLCPEHTSCTVRGKQRGNGGIGPTQLIVGFPPREILLLHFPPPVSFKGRRISPLPSQFPSWLMNLLSPSTFECFSPLSSSGEEEKGKGGW